MLISALLNAYMVILIIRVIYSWIRPTNPSQFHYLVYKLTEPVLEPIRKIIPPIGGVLDISPIIVFFIIGILKRFII